jgi:alkyl hydroperoxide reductase subunit AhpF
MSIKELIIIGAGPAGITAAVYAARKRLDFSVISRDIGGQAAWSGEIENYTGYQFISGPELALKFKEHMEKYSFDLKEGVGVTRVEKDKDGFKVVTDKAGEFLARTVIVASGKRPRLLNVPGEAKFKNHGLTFCATCDGPLFAGKDVAIVGGGNSGLDAALQMMKIGKKVYLLEGADKLSGDSVMQEKIRTAPQVEILTGTKVKKILGDKFVSAIEVESQGKPRKLDVQGVFVEIGLVPNSDFIDFVKKNEKREIIINGFSETSVEGLFAAGDVTDVPAKQIIVAAGDGANRL